MKSAGKSEAVVKKTRLAKLRQHAEKRAQTATAAPAATPEDAPPAKEIVPLPTNSVVIRDQKNIDWNVRVPPGTPRDDLENPARWVNAADAKQMQPGDSLRIFGEDSGGNYYGEAIVVQAGKGFRPVVLMLRLVGLPRLQHFVAGIPDGYEIRYDPAWNAWFAWRLKDGASLTQEPGRPTHEECRRELLDHAIFRT